MGLTYASQARAKVTEEWNHFKLDVANGRHNIMIDVGLVSWSYRADFCAIVIPNDIELKQQLMCDHHDSPTSSHLGVYYIIGSLSSHYYW